MAALRIAVAGISHETNTYCSAATADMDFHVERGARLERSRGQQSDVGGALDAIERAGAIAVPILFATAQPSGIVDAGCYAALKQEILDGLDRERPDAVVLCLHGAGVVQGIPDLEADLVTAVRGLVGRQVPITASFDLHGNVTQVMADSLDGVFACHHYPHVDLHERAAEAVALAMRLCTEPLRTTIHVTRLPMLLPTTTTFLGPGERFLDAVLAAEAEPGVIDVSWFHGFPYTDVAHVGSAIVVTTEGDRDRARAIAGRLSGRLWTEREAFRPQSLSATEAVAAARAVGPTTGPVVIHETSDNCGGGAPGDGTHLLRAMLDARLADACFGFLVDPAAAAAAHAAGVGSTLDLALGGRYDDLHGAPLHVRAYVKALHDGRLTMQAMFRGAPLHLGKLARLQVEGMDVIVASRRSQTFDPEPFLAVGVDVTRLRYVALKSSNHFRAGFQALAGAIVTADPPGLTTHHIEIFPRVNATCPLWPIDAEANFDPDA